MNKVAPLPDSARKYLKHQAVPTEDEEDGRRERGSEVFELSNSDSENFFTYEEYRKGPPLCSESSFFARLCTLCALYTVMMRLRVNGFGYTMPGNHNSWLLCVTSMPVVHVLLIASVFLSIVAMPDQPIFMVFLILLVCYPFYIAHVARRALFERYGISTEGHEAEECCATGDIRGSIERMYYFVQTHPLPSPGV